MQPALSKYNERSPRYILQPLDNTLVRLAGPKQTPWEESTEIKNISLSGLSFTAPLVLCPLVGEFIKIQFEVPGSTQMACYGLVTRIHPLKDSICEVGVQFKKLDLPQRIVLAQGLALKLKNQIDHLEIDASKFNFTNFIKQKRRTIAFGFAALAIWILLFYAFSITLSST